MFTAIMMSLAINSMAYANTTSMCDMPTTNDVEIMERWMDDKDINKMTVNTFSYTENGFDFTTTAGNRCYTVNYEVELELFGHTILDSFKTSSTNVIKNYR